MPSVNSKISKIICEYSQEYGDETITLTITPKVDATTVGLLRADHRDTF